jgi:predicted RNA-binding protein with TRAM domain
MLNVDISLNALRAARTHAAKNDVRYYLNGVCFNFRNGHILATDGHRLFIGNSVKADHDEIIVPNDLIDNVLKACGKSYPMETILLSVMARRYHLKRRMVSLLARLLTVHSPTISVSYRRISVMSMPLLTWIIWRMLKMRSRYITVEGQKHYVKIHYNGNGSAIVESGYGAFVVVMPTRYDGSNVYDVIRSVIDNQTVEQAA